MRHHPVDDFIPLFFDVPHVGKDCLRYVPDLSRHVILFAIVKDLGMYDPNKAVFLGALSLSCNSDRGGCVVAMSSVITALVHRSQGRVAQRCNRF